MMYMGYFFPDTVYVMFFSLFLRFKPQVYCRLFTVSSPVHDLWG